MEWNEPLYKEGLGDHSRVGVLVLHGFGGSPYSMQGYAVRLVDVGYTVALPLLTGHATAPEDMERARWSDWTRDAEAGYAWLVERTDKIFVTGLSMGGTLAIWIAEHHPEVVGLITVNAALRFRVEPVMHVLGILGCPRWLKAVGNDIRKPGQDERAYAKIPVRAMRQLALLLSETRRALPAVECPALVFSSPADHVVPPANQRELFARLRTGDKEFVQLTQSHHCATLDNDREQIFQGALRFIAARS